MPRVPDRARDTRRQPLPRYEGMRAWATPVALLGSALVFFAGYPLLLEDVGHPCAALERRLMTTRPEWAGHQPNTVFGLAFRDALMQELAGGHVASAMARQQYPLLPPVVACTVAYWNSIVQ